MSHSVSEIIEMARALSEGDFDREFQQLFQGELGEVASYLNAVRQTLQSLSTMTDISCAILPNAADGVAAIRQETETRFDSLWEMVEIMQEDQAAVRSILGHGDDLSTDEVASLREIANKSKQTLLSLMSYLTFQDVLRQRLEKLQALIETLEKKAFDLVAKFDVKTNKKQIQEGACTALPVRIDLDQILVDQLLASLR
jgi:hypothetical protein